MSDSRPLLCISHGGCHDGHTAAWLVEKAFPGTEHWPTGYGTPPPDVAGRNVLIVDFSYPRDVLDAMADKALMITVLDHHETAQRHLEGIESAWSNVRAVFDMERSGARITWDWLVDERIGYEFATRNAAAQWLVNYVQDRDLWRFELPESRAITAAIRSYPLTFEAWDELAESPVEEIRLEGVAIQRQMDRLIEEVISTTRRTMVIAGLLVSVVNCQYALGSDVAGRLAEEDPTAFAAYYLDTPSARQFGLRSGPDGENVALVAEQYGGGGHAHASGFKVPRDHPLALS